MISDIVMDYVKAIKEARTEVEILTNLRLILAHVHQDHTHVNKILTHLECITDEVAGEYGDN